MLFTDGVRYLPQLPMLLYAVPELMPVPEGDGVDHEVTMEIVINVELKSGSVMIISKNQTPLCLQDCWRFSFSQAIH